MKTERYYDSHYPDDIDEESSTAWIELKEYQKLRQNKTAFKTFVELFVSGVLIKVQFDKNKRRTLFRHFCTPSTEAFTLLLLENNWDLWTEIAKQRYVVT